MADFSEAKVVCSYLKDYGYEAYIVGGFIRDLIISDSIKSGAVFPEHVIEGDIDIATNASPEQVMKLFRGENFVVVPVGEKFGTVKLFDPLEEPIEITTYRSEGKYSDNRHPDNVVWEKELIKDLSRRDFTINAIAFDPFIEDEKCFIDPYNGIQDIKNKVICAVGNPLERFRDDPLRMLRMARFVAKLGFKLDESTFISSKVMCDTINNIPYERIKDEFFKMLKYEETILGLKIMRDTGLLDKILPELTNLSKIDQPKNHHLHNVMDHMFATMDYIGKCDTPILKFAMLIHDIGKTECADSSPYFKDHETKGLEIFDGISKRWKLSSEEDHYVKFIIQHHMDDKHFDNWRGDAPIRRWLSKLGNDVKYIDDLFLMFNADIKGSGYNKEEYLIRVAKIQESVKRILSEKPALSVKDLAVNGNDMMEIGIPVGPKIGKILGSLLCHVIESPKDNNKEFLINLTKTLYMANELYGSQMG